jgi:hypothetical protein
MAEVEKKEKKESSKLAAEREAAEVQKYIQRFRRAEQGMGEKHRKWETIDTFDRGEQWKNANLPPWVPKPVNNMIRYFRTLKRANLASAIPKSTFTPILPDYADDVRKLQDAYDHIWEAEKIPRVIRRCIDRSIAQGTGLAYVYNDETYIGGIYYEEHDSRNIMYHGRICAKWWPNTNFFIDPDAYCIKDAKYIETTEIVPLSVIKKNKKFIEYAGKLKIQGLKGDQLDFEDSGDGTIFNRDNKPSDTGVGRDDGDSVATIHCHWERFLNDKGRWQLNCTYYTKNNAFILYKIEDIKPNCYPFAVIYFEEEEQDFWGTGQSEDVLDNQQVINKADQTASIIGVLHQNPQKVVSRESGINAQELAKFGSLPGRVWTTNTSPADSIHHVEPPDIPKGLFELSDRVKQDMREVVGITDSYTGESVGSLTTSTGVNSLIERATVRDKDKMIQIDDFIEDLSDIIVKFVLYSWKDKRPIMKTNPNGTPAFGMYTPIDELDAENIEYRVKSDVYARAPVTQAMKKQQADQLMQLQGQFNFNPPIITPEEWILLQDFENKADILRRMEDDRKKLQAQEASNMAGMIQQVADQVAAAKAAGEPDQVVQQIAMQAAQQLLQQKQAEDAKNGNLAAPAANQAQGPQGTTGAMAMNAMAKGM